MVSHEDAVSTIAKKVQYFYEHKEPFWIYHGSTNSTRPVTFDRSHMIDTSQLNNILTIDNDNLRAIVEPNVSMDQLVIETLRHGLVPPVVPEFPGITVGGAFAGTAGESSSFKYGFFDRTVNWVEMVLGNGETVVTNAVDKDPDLYHAASGSFGSLGVLTLLEVQLIRASRYVHVTYHRTQSMSEAVRILKNLMAKPDTEFLDGIAFERDDIVVISGKYSEPRRKQISALQTFQGASDPWYYLHAKRMSSLGYKEISEFVPVTDYLFRYDRGAFWTGMYAFRYFLMPFNWVTRWALDYFMHTRVMYRALHASGHSKRYIIQDVAVPLSKSEEFFHFIDESYRIYPLWICPLKQGNQQSFHPSIRARPKSGGDDDNDDTEKTRTEATQEHDDPDQTYSLNFGIWGPGSPDWPAFVAQNRRLEQKVRELGGLKWLYAHTFYTEEEFWQIYDWKWYEAVRAKYKATSLPSVYEKVRVDVARQERQRCPSRWRLVQALWGVWPVSGLYGVYKALVGRENLIGK